MTDGFAPGRGSEFRRRVMERLRQAEVADEAGRATALLAEQIGYQGSTPAFAQLLAGMERSAMIQREVRGKRTYRIRALGGGSGMVSQPHLDGHAGSDEAPKEHAGGERTASDGSSTTATVTRIGLAGLDDGDEASLESATDQDQPLLTPVRSGRRSPSSAREQSQAGSLQDPPGPNDQGSDPNQKLAGFPAWLSDPDEAVSSVLAALARALGSVMAPGGSSSGSRALGDGSSAERARAAGTGGRMQRQVVSLERQVSELERELARTKAERGRLTAENADLVSRLEAAERNMGVIERQLRSRPQRGITQQSLDPDEMAMLRSFMSKKE